ncbi:MAG: acyl-CoA thioesterase [Actinobacteria bacterium]|nr:acyl-CoA thioesterase [Actinomycetota bacterium]
MSVEHVERLRVAWVDTDAGGRIHFSNAFRWAEVAEVGLVRDVLSIEEWGDFPRKHVHAEFLKVLRFEDEIEVRLRVDRLGTTSITYAWTISKDGEPYVRGGHTVVHVDADGRPTPLPDRIRVALSG